MPYPTSNLPASWVALEPRNPLWDMSKGFFSIFSGVAIEGLLSLRACRESLWLVRTAVGTGQGTLTSYFFSSLPKCFPLKRIFSPSGRDCPNSGQASPCPSEQSPSPQSPQNNCSGKSTDPKNVAALKVLLISLEP